MVILTEYIAKHELKSLRQYFEIQDILEGARKILYHLAVEIKPPQKFEGSRFFKVRIGRKVKGRMIVFMIVENKKIVPILIRLKSDKIFGMNMAMNNPQVTEQLKKNLHRVIDDIQKKKFEEFFIPGLS